MDTTCPNCGEVDAIMRASWCGTDYSVEWTDNVPEAIYAIRLIAAMMWGSAREHAIQLWAAGMYEDYPPEWWNTRSQVSLTDGWLDFQDTEIGQNTIFAACEFESHCPTCGTSVTPLHDYWGMLR